MKKPTYVPAENLEDIPEDFDAEEITKRFFGEPEAEGCWERLGLAVLMMLGLIEVVRRLPTYCFIRN